MAIKFLTTETPHISMKKDAAGVLNPEKEEYTETELKTIWQGQQAVETETKTKKSSLKVALEKVQTETEKLTAEYVKAYQKYVEADAKNLAKKMEDIRKKLQAIANEQGEANQPYVFTCDEGEVEFSERGTNTEVKNPIVLVNDLVDKLGVDAAFTAVKIGLTELKKLLSEKELEPYVEKSPGSRTLKECRPKK